MPAVRPTLNPQILRAGDAVALVSPAGPVAEARVEAAVRELSSWGLRPRVYPHALEAEHFLAGSDAHRVADLNDALADPEIRAVLCTRGGYGVQRILAHIDSEAGGRFFRHHGVARGVVDSHGAGDHSWSGRGTT
jgi:muramoyltetrapeptide carboxypeptidase